MATVLVGRERLRVIQSALMRKVYSGLEARGWFSEGKHQPIEILSEPLDHDKEITPNKISIVLEDSWDYEVELGSHLTEDTWECYIDIYAENQLIGEGLAADIYALLRGKMPSIGHGSTTIPVIDYRDKKVAFHCEIRDVRSERQRNNDRKYLRYWWTIAFDLIDTYYDDTISIEETADGEDLQQD